MTQYGERLMICEVPERKKRWNSLQDLLAMTCQFFSKEFLIKYWKEYLTSFNIKINEKIQLILQEISIADSLIEC